jgi:hypothetical protein
MKAKPRKTIQAPQRYKERPTAERMMRGKWRLGETIDAGIKVAIDDGAHILDAMRHEGLISSEQHQAGFAFEELYRSQCEIPQARDSTTIWEPKGFASDDGPVEERRRYKEVSRALGMIHESRLIWACVHHNPPKGNRAIGELREALNAAIHAFQPGGQKRPLHPFAKNI